MSSSVFGAATRKEKKKTFSLARSLALALSLTEYDDSGRPLPPRRPNTRRRRDDREQGAPREAQQHGDRPVGELQRQRGLRGDRGGGLPLDRGRALHGKVDEEGVEEDRDQIVERRRRDDQRRDALRGAEPSLLQVKHQLDDDRGPDGLEDEPESVGQQPGHAEDGVGDGSGDDGLDDARDQQQAHRRGARAPEDFPVQFQSRPQEDHRERPLPDLGLPRGRQRGRQPGDRDVRHGDAGEQHAQQRVQAREGDQGAAGLCREPDDEDRPHLASREHRGAEEEVAGCFVCVCVWRGGEGGERSGRGGKGGREEEERRRGRRTRSETPSSFGRGRRRTRQPK